MNEKENIKEERGCSNMNIVQKTEEVMKIMKYVAILEKLVVYTINLFIKRGRIMIIFDAIYINLFY